MSDGSESDWPAVTTLIKAMHTPLYSELHSESIEEDFRQARLDSLYAKIFTDKTHKLILFWIDSQLAGNIICTLKGTCAYITAASYAPEDSGPSIIQAFIRYLTIFHSQITTIYGACVNGNGPICQQYRERFVTLGFKHTNDREPLTDIEENQRSHHSGYVMYLPTTSPDYYTSQSDLSGECYYSSSDDSFEDETSSSSYTEDEYYVSHKTSGTQSE
jgi:hypothetical protein